MILGGVTRAVAAELRFGSARSFSIDRIGQRGRCCGYGTTSRVFKERYTSSGQEEWKNRSWMIAIVCC